MSYLSFVHRAARRPLAVVLSVAFVVALTAVACAPERKAETPSAESGVAGAAAAAAESVVQTQSALTILGGDVWARFGDAPYEDAVDGDELVEGDTVRTGADSYAVLTFANGAIVELEPESEITIEALHFDVNGDFTLLLRQEEGESWHVVENTLTPNSRYEVATDDMTTSVEGTSFRVATTKGSSTGVVVAAPAKVPATVINAIRGSSTPTASLPSTQRATAVATTTGKVNAAPARAAVVTKPVVPAPAPRPKTAAPAAPVRAPVKAPAAPAAARPAVPAQPAPAQPAQPARPAQPPAGQPQSAAAQRAYTPPKAPSALPPKIVPPGTAPQQAQPNVAAAPRAIAASVQIPAGQASHVQQLAFGGPVAAPGGPPAQQARPAAPPPGPPVKFPDPPVTVKITLDGTPGSATVTDPKGRALGVDNGKAVNYIPGSTVAVENGRLVMTVPNVEPGRVSTVIKDAHANAAAAAADKNLNVYNIQTEVFASGVGQVANMVESRPVSTDGTVKGGVAVTSLGLVALPQNDAQAFYGAKLATLPDLPKGTALDITKVAAPPSIVTPIMSQQASQTLPAGMNAGDVAKVVAGMSSGGFQAFQAPAAGAGGAPAGVGGPPAGVGGPPAGIPAGLAADAAAAMAKFSAFTQAPPIGSFGAPQGMVLETINGVLQGYDPRQTGGLVPPGFAGGPPAGTQGGPPAGIQLGPPAGVQGGPPAGVSGGPPAGVPGGLPGGALGGPPAGITIPGGTGQGGAIQIPTGATDVSNYIQQLMPPGVTIPSVAGLAGVAGSGFNPFASIGMPPSGVGGPAPGIAGGPPAGAPQGPPSGTAGGPPSGIIGGPPAGMPQGPPADVPQRPPESLPGAPPAGVPSGMPAIPSGMPALPGEMPAVPSGMPAIPSGMPAIPSGMPALPSGMPAIPSGMPALPSGMPAIPSGAPPGGVPEAPPAAAPAPVPQAPPAAAPAPVPQAPPAGIPRFP